MWNLKPRIVNLDSTTSPDSLGVDEQASGQPAQSTRTDYDWEREQIPVCSWVSSQLSATHFSSTKRRTIPEQQQCPACHTDDDSHDDAARIRTSLSMNRGGARVKVALSFTHLFSYRYLQFGSRSILLNDLPLTLEMSSPIHHNLNTVDVIPCMACQVHHYPADVIGKAKSLSGIL